MGPSTGQALCGHPLVRKVDLTGGTSTGRVVAAAAGSNLAGVITELGGKAPMLIFNDADINQVSSLTSQLRGPMHSGCQW